MLALYCPVITKDGLPINVYRDLNTYMKKWAKWQWVVGKKSYANESEEQKKSIFWAPQGGFIDQQTCQELHETDSPLLVLDSRVYDDYYDVHDENTQVITTTVNVDFQDIQKAARAYAYYAHEFNDDGFLKRALEYNLLGLYLSQYQSSSENYHGNSSHNLLPEEWKSWIQKILDRYQTRKAFEAESQQETKQLKDAYGLNDSSIAQEEQEKRTLLMCLDRKVVMDGTIELLKTGIAKNAITIADLKWDGATHYKWLQASYAQTLQCERRGEKEKFLINYDFLRTPLLSYGDVTHKRAIFNCAPEAIGEMVLRTHMLADWLPALDLHDERVQKWVLYQLKESSAREIPSLTDDLSKDQQKIIAYILDTLDLSGSLSDSKAIAPLLSLLPKLLPQNSAENTNAIALHEKAKKKKKKKKSAMLAIKQKGVDLSLNNEQKGRLGDLLCWYVKNDQKKNAVDLLEALMQKQFMFASSAVQERIDIDSLMALCQWSQENKFVADATLITVLFDILEKEKLSIAHDVHVEAGARYARNALKAHTFASDDSSFPLTASVTAQKLQVAAFVTAFRNKDAKQMWEVMQEGMLVGKHRVDIAQMLFAVLCENPVFSEKEHALWGCLYQVGKEHPDFAWELVRSLDSEKKEVRLQEFLVEIKQSTSMAPLLPFIAFFREHVSDELSKETVQTCRQSENISQQCTSYLALLEQARDITLPFDERITVLNHLKDLLFAPVDSKDTSVAILRNCAIRELQYITSGKRTSVLENAEGNKAPVFHLYGIWSYIEFLAHEGIRIKEFGDIDKAREHIIALYEVLQDTCDFFGKSLGNTITTDQQLRALVAQAHKKIDQVELMINGSDELHSHDEVNYWRSVYYWKKATHPFLCSTMSNKEKEQAANMATSYANRSIEYLQEEIKLLQKQEHQQQLPVEALKQMQIRLLRHKAHRVDIEAISALDLFVTNGTRKKTMRVQDSSKVKEILDRLIPFSPFSQSINALAQSYRYYVSSATWANTQALLKTEKKKALHQLLIERGLSEGYGDDKQWYKPLFTYIAEQSRCAYGDITVSDIFNVVLTQCKKIRELNNGYSYDADTRKQCTTVLSVLGDSLDKESIEHAQINLLASYYRYLDAQIRFANDVNGRNQEYAFLEQVWQELATIQRDKVTQKIYFADEPLRKELYCLIASAIELKMTTYLERNQGTLSLEMYNTLQEESEILSLFAADIRDDFRAIKETRISEIVALIEQRKPVRS